MGPQEIIPRDTTFMLIIISQISKLVLTEPIWQTHSTNLNETIAKGLIHTLILKLLGHVAPTNCGTHAPGAHSVSI